MRTLYLTLAAIAVMALLIPLAPFMAVTQGGGCTSSLLPHFIYMFGHAGLLHWAVNSWALLVLHNLFRQARLFVAYVLAVIASFVPSCSPYAATALQSPSQHPVLGASVITCFFFGLLMPSLWRKDRLSACMTAALILIAFFIPGIAAFHHLLMFLSGIAWSYIERAWCSFLLFCNTRK